MTNDFKVALELNNALGVFCSVTGGNSLQGSGCPGGRPGSCGRLKRFIFTRLFFRFPGLALPTDIRRIRWKKQLFTGHLLTRCEELIIVADYRKFDKTGFSRIADLKAAQKVVTNKEVGDDYKEYYFQNNIKLFTPYEVEEINEPDQTDQQRGGDGDGGKKYTFWKCVIFPSPITIIWCWTGLIYGLSPVRSMACSVKTAREKQPWLTSSMELFRKIPVKYY